MTEVYKFVQFQVYTTEAGVQICSLSSWSMLYKLHLGLSVQIHTLIPVFSQTTIK